MFKKIGKILLWFIVIIGLIIGIISYRLETAIQTNREYILTKVFEKDSEGRGYSDRAKRLMEEELTIFNNDQIMRKYFDRLLKLERQLALVTSKKEYFDTFILRGKVSSCLGDYVIRTYSNDKPRKKFKNWLKEDESFESNNMNELLTIVEKQYSPNPNMDEWSLLMNSRPTDQECQDYLK